MNRVTATKCFIKLLSAMYLAKENAFADYLKRSDEEQWRMFQIKKSSCDGVRKVSNHQRGKAIDIYFMDPVTNQLSSPIMGWKYWHEYWEKILEKEGAEAEGITFEVNGMLVHDWVHFGIKP